MKKTVMIVVIFLCIVLLALPFTTRAQSKNKSWDDAQAIERDSKNAEKEAKEGNYEGAREGASQGFDDYIAPLQDGNNYYIPEPVEPEIDNE